MIVAAVTVGDDDLLTSVPRHFGSGFPQELLLKLRAVSHCARLMFRLENLAEVIFGKNDRILQLRAMH